MTKIRMSLLCLATLAVGLAQAAPYDIKLTDDVSVGKTQLKAGDYSVEIRGDKAVFKGARKTIEVPATLEKNDHAFRSTVLVSLHSRLQEIDLGGTEDKIVFNVPATR